MESGNAVRTTIANCEDARTFKLLKQRAELKEKMEKAKDAAHDETKRLKFNAIDNKYSSSNAEELEKQFAAETVGLISAADFAAKRKRVDELIAAGASADALKPKKEKEDSIHKVEKSKLSFADDSEEESEEEEIVIPKKRNFGKDPSVNTSFLRDAERDEMEAAERAKHVAEYEEIMKEERARPLTITYSYWDGAGHRRKVTIPTGSTIREFLEKARQDLSRDFPELKSIMVDSLMYVKEDLFIPHSFSFHDLIKNKARGKSGPLFNFDVVEDIRMNNDSRIEKNDSHAGKIVDRKWYERNKHIFPASRWEQYDPNKTFDKYTIFGHNDDASKDIQ